MSGSVLALPRKMPDPIGPGSRMLNDGEYRACVRLLRDFAAPKQALAVLGFDDVEARAWTALWGAGYFEEVDDGPPPRIGTKWCRVRASAAGRAWLSQVSGA